MVRDLLLVVGVSILAQPEGRARPGVRTAAPADRRPRFNPRPARRPGATALRVERPPLFVGVSILAQPEGRARHPAILVGGHHVAVSILAQPEGRARRARAHRVEATGRVFQSSPSPKAGRDGRGRTGRPARDDARFNPRPARRPGATRPARDDARTGGVVSILAQPEGRARPDARDLLLLGDLFQSSPSPKAGRDSRSSRRSSDRRRVSILAQPEGRARLVIGFVAGGGDNTFQSSPSPKAGRDDRRRRGTRAFRLRFNPRPARRPGATHRAERKDRYHAPFQSSPSPKAGRDPPRTAGRRVR